MLDIITGIVFFSYHLISNITISNRFSESSYFLRIERCRYMNFSLFDSKSYTFQGFLIRNVMIEFKGSLTWIQKNCHFYTKL